MTEMVCEECGAKADLMAVWNGKVICFTCLAKNQPILASKVVGYLTKFVEMRAWFVDV